MEASQPVDENESRRQQIQVGDTLPTENTQRKLDCVAVQLHYCFLDGWKITPHITRVLVFI